MRAILQTCEFIPERDMYRIDWDACCEEHKLALAGMIRMTDQRMWAIDREAKCYLVCRLLMNILAPFFSNASEWLIKEQAKR